IQVAGVLQHQCSFNRGVLVLAAILERNVNDWPTVANRNREGKMYVAVAKVSWPLRLTILLCLRPLGSSLQDPGNVAGVRIQSGRPDSLADIAIDLVGSLDCDQVHVRLAQIHTVWVRPAHCVKLT